MPVRWDKERGSGTTPGEWLESPYLGRVAARVAQEYGLRPDDLPDLLQELRIALWKQGLDQRVGEAWVVRVTRHKAVDLLRQRMRTRRRDGVFTTIAARPWHDPEIDHLLHAKAESLPPKLKAFYALHYQLGLSEREIGRRLGICRASVRWLDHCCRQFVAADRR